MNLREFNAENGIAVLVQNEFAGDLPRAMLHGANLFQMGIVPSVIITGMEELDRIEGESISDGMKARLGLGIIVLKSPAVTQPQYRDGVVLSRGEIASLAHFCLAEEGVSIYWTESATVFEARINAAVFERYPGGEPVLFNLCAEALVLLYYTKVSRLQRIAIPCDEGRWMPKRGGGIVFSKGFNFAREFLPDFTIVE